MSPPGGRRPGVASSAQRFLIRTIGPALCPTQLPGEESITVHPTLPRDGLPAAESPERAVRSWARELPLVSAWAAGRALVLLTALGLVSGFGPGVSTDVKVIYLGWAEVLRTGTFPLDDVTWQYPPLAALVILLPSWLSAVLPWSYFTCFLVLVAVCDAIVLALLRRASRRQDGSRAGAWLWVGAVPLLGPTAYCRFDLVVTAVAVAGLLAAAGRPRLGGLLAGAGALLKVWPVLILLGTPRGRRTRDAWGAMAASALALCFCCAVTMNGGFSFLAFQGDRGVEVESLGALPFYLAHLFGWGGHAEMHYGSLEFLGTGVRTVAWLMLALSAGAVCWLLLWRVRARRWTAATPFDAALTALLLFTVTSRVISPQYVVWLLGIAAVCLTSRETVQRPVACLLGATSALTLVEFPLRFGDLAAFHALGVTALCARNVLLVAATLLACARLWRASTRDP
jgi:hypothetical protein